VVKIACTPKKIKMPHKHFLAKEVKRKLANAKMGKLGGKIEQLKLEGLKSNNYET
jgi:hypothetical protein